MIGPDPSFVRWLLRRERAITMLSLLMLCGLAWAYLASGAGMPGDTAMAMDARSAMTPAPSFFLVLAMWWVMMLAMMLPSAAPAILLYDKVHERALAGRSAPPPTPAVIFAFGYLLCWLLFSVVAAFIELRFQALDLDSTKTSSVTGIGAGLIVVVAGLYQLSPLKAVCLTHCRSPASFFARHWRPGWTGAVCLGVRHGAFCVACCWALMLLLFVGGVMNLAWVAVLSVFVLAEKLLPFGPIVARVSGAVLVIAGLGILLIGTGS